MRFRVRGYLGTETRITLTINRKDNNMLELMGFVLAISFLANIMQLVMIVEMQAYRRGYNSAKNKNR